MIRPSLSHPVYWEYRGQPTLLLGGSKEDNLFQIPDLKEHLDLLASVGGNVIRNTMSDRDPGDVYAFARGPDGQYDLDQWNAEYWERFERMLQWTSERAIIVQLELWDRFDYSREPWLSHPFNPRNQSRLTTEATGLEPDYPRHPSHDLQPFFHTIPGMADYHMKLDAVRHYQERFVSKLLSISLRFDHLLYCMNNETSTDPAWGAFWIRFIKEKAAAEGKEVYATDMFDDFHKAEESRMVPVVTQNPERYAFFDISQVNSRHFGFGHWQKLQFLIGQSRVHPRPANHTKIYSDGQTDFGSGTPQDGLERFWRNLMAGSASARFHRPPAGIGLNELAQHCIRGARWVESQIPFWEMTPAMHCIRPPDHENNRAYLSSTQDGRHLLFLTKGGGVELDLGKVENTWQITWFDIGSGQLSDLIQLPAITPLSVQSPFDGASIAVLKSETPI